MSLLITFFFLKWLKARFSCIPSCPILFHPFSAFFILFLRKRQKKAEKGREGIPGKFSSGKPCVVALPSNTIFEGRATTQGFPSCPNLSRSPFLSFLSVGTERTERTGKFSCIPSWYPFPFCPYFLKDRKEGPRHKFSNLSQSPFLSFLSVGTERTGKFCFGKP